jgi:hypothetical protein
MAGRPLRGGRLPGLRPQGAARRRCHHRRRRHRAKIEEIAKSDPFSVAGVAEYAVTELVATKTAPSLEQFRQELTR